MKAPIPKGRLRLAFPLTLLLALAIGVAACGSSTPKKKPEQQPAEEQKAQPEEKVAEQTTAAADEAKTKGPAKVPPNGSEEKTAPGAAMTAKQEPAPPEPERRAARATGTGKIPYDKAFPNALKGIPPVRIGVLSSTGSPAAGERIGLILRRYQRRRLERALGRPVRVAFVSRSSKKHKAKTLIRYRPKFLKAAIQVASAIPQQQVVEPMTRTELEREEVDMFIYVGEKVR